MTNVIGPIDIDEFVEFIIGEKIGSGVHRDVYEYKPDPTCVIKHESGHNNFMNIQEWLSWKHVLRAGKSYAKWLAPCVSISNGGNLLVMKKTGILRAEEYPDRIPHWLPDTHRKNFGMLDGQFVSHDYAFVLELSADTRKFNNRKVKVDWGNPLNSSW